jgi:hypothetical protein
MPFSLGFNDVVAKLGAITHIALPEDQGGHPLLVLGEHGRGRSVAWTSDIEPHWLPMDVLDWSGSRHSGTISSDRRQGKPEAARDMDEGPGKGTKARGQAAPHGRVKWSSRSSPAGVPRP